MSEYTSINVPTPLRDDFVDVYGWDRVAAEMGGERTGMRDAFTAVQYALVKGKGTRTIRLYPQLVPILRQMLEVRWADHFQTMSELEGPYSRAVDQLKKITANAKKR